LLLHIKEAHLRGVELTLPTVALAEAWRGGANSARGFALLGACLVEPLFEDLARVAVEAMGAVKGATVVDAIVMGSAARRGDRVLTSDFDDMDRLRTYFPAVRLLSV
jgi:hypothetical protein